MASRLRKDVKHMFDAFVEVVSPTSTISSPSRCPTGTESHIKEPWVLQTFPTHFKDKEKVRLKSVPNFVFPCSMNVTTVQNFSFVLTDVDANWTFGFCRHAPRAETALVILSSLPWHDTFYRILNFSAELLSHSSDPDEVWRFLQACYDLPRIPDPGKPLRISWRGPAGKPVADFTCLTPDSFSLPSIPANRNLTEYYNAVGVETMLEIFASMLSERRVVISSRKLARLSACVQAANDMIYPMHWQHIFIPILPKHLCDYLCAPMPFLIGVPAPLMQTVRLDELGDVVILDADANHVSSPFQDLQNLPLQVTSSLRQSLRNHRDLLGDAVARAFLQAIVHLIGGYRDALSFRQGDKKMTFSEERFLRSRPSSFRPFLESLLELQLFRQFIDDRLNQLNTGQGVTDQFELEAIQFTDKYAATLGSNRQQKIRHQAAAISSSVRKEGGAIVKAVKNKANPAVVKQAVKNVKAGGKSAYKGVKSRIKENNSGSNLGSLSDKDVQDSIRTFSAPASPTILRHGRRLLDGSIDDSSSSCSVSSRDITDLGAGSSMPPRQHTDLFIKPPLILKYKHFEPPPATCERSPEMEAPSPLDLDLMTDLKDIIFKRPTDEADRDLIDLVPSTSSDSCNLKKTDDGIDVIFDPLLVSEDVRSSTLLHPPNLNSSKPVDHRMRHRPLNRTTVSDVPVPLRKSAPSSSSFSGGRVTSHEQRKDCSASSENLLKEYGLDFSKISFMSSTSSAGCAQMYNQLANFPTPANISSPENVPISSSAAILAELDPLRRDKDMFKHDLPPPPPKPRQQKLSRTGVAANKRVGVVDLDLNNSSTSASPPVAPSRIKKSQKFVVTPGNGGWTTFD